MSPGADLGRHLATVLDKFMDLIFELLPVDRGFLLLDEENGALQLRISRFKSKKRMTADGTTPYSRTIVDMVVKQKVAILTSDAQTDERFESGESIRMQQIRSAMCAPLWNGDSSGLSTSIRRSTPGTFRSRIWTC